MRDVRAELVRSKAYRITYWVWPLILLSTLAAVAFSSSAIQKALEEGATPTSQIEALAFMPGSPTFFSGLLLAFWTTTLVTADWSSGTINHIHMAMSDGRILRAKLIMVSAASLLTTVITTGTAVALSFLLLPSSLVLATLPSSGSTFWARSRSISRGAFWRWLPLGGSPSPRFQWVPFWSWCWARQLWRRLSRPLASAPRSSPISRPPS